MTALSAAPALDRPWKRPGSARYALKRMRGFVRTPVEVYEPAPGAVVVQHDAPVTMRDGTALRVNVHLPGSAVDGPFPVLLCAHPYGKDKLPTKKKRGNGYSLPFQYRALRQPTTVRFSSLTSWEAPDPAWW